MQIDQIFVNTIKAIAQEVESHDYNCDSILANMKGEVQTQKINNTLDKIIVRNVSDSITTIIIDCKAGKITAITFNGSIAINAKELFEMFKDYRERYSVRDDLYFYFLNESKENGSYTLSFFEPSHKHINAHESDEALTNITLSW